MAPRKKAEAKESTEDSPTKASKKTAKKKTTKKKTTGKRGRPRKTTKKAAARKTVRPKKVVKEEPVEEVVETEEVVQEEVQEEFGANSIPSSLVVEKPTQWILVKQMQFGIINEGFPIGTVFTVDWNDRRMRCEGNGMIYDNIKDLEIAIKIGTVEPYVADGSFDQYQQQQFIESESRASKNRQMINGRKNRDDEVRDMVSRSDQDVVQSIDISNTCKTKKEPTPVHVTPTSQVTLNKPQQPNQMEVHYSDSPQDGRIVRASNQPTVRSHVQQTRTGAKPLSPVLAGKHDWDAGSGEGRIQNEISQKMSDYSIKVDEHGQQYIRGLPVIRDDSEASGPSLNAGSVISLTKEQLAERAQRIAQIRAEKQADVAQNRSNSGVQVNEAPVNNPAANVQDVMPQEIVPGVGYSDSGITPVETAKQPETKSRKTSSTAGKLLRRR
jgi:hypothetical protein